MTEPSQPKSDAPTDSDQRPAGWVRTFLVAVQFLSRIPVPGGNQPTNRATLARAIVFFPLVGGLIGALTAAVMGAGQMIWPVYLAALVALAVEAWLTGAFHEDAVGDFFDAFGGGYTRARVLEILKDSRIGSFGTVAIALGLLLRCAAMGAIALVATTAELIAAIVGAAAAGRLAILAAMALLPPVKGRASLAKDVGSRASLGLVVAGGLLALPVLAPLVWLWPMYAAAAAVAAAVTTVLFVRVVERRLGGITGDCLGCLCYLVQVVVLLAAAAAPPTQQLPPQAAALVQGMDPTRLVEAPTWFEIAQATAFAAAETALRVLAEIAVVWP